MDRREGTPYEDRLKSLKLPTLSLRREFLSLVQLFKFIKGYSALETNDYMSLNNRHSRNSHRYKLFKPYCRTDIFKNSSWHRYIDKWNNLPASIFEHDSVKGFKNALKKSFLAN
jgi:hypothetical protein